MQIKNLDLMEKIVKKYNKNLSWIGWDVVDRRRSESGRTAVSGVRVNDQWYVQTIYPLTSAGWNIPNKYKV